MSSPWAAVLAGLGQAASGLGRDINERRAMEEQQKRIDEQNRRVAEQQALENLLRIRAAGGSIVPQGTDPQQALARLTTGNTLRSIGATSGGAFGIPSFSVPDLDGKPELQSAGGMNILFDPSQSPDAIATRRQSLAQIAADRRAKQTQDAASALETQRETARTQAVARAAQADYETLKSLNPSHPLAQQPFNADYATAYRGEVDAAHHSADAKAQREGAYHPDPSGVLVADPNNPNGPGIYVPRGQEIGKSAPASTRTSVPTEGERQAAALLPEIETAQATLDSMTPVLLTEQVRHIPVLGNFIKTDKGRQFEQMATQFINNVIYAKSGKAITKEEFQRAYDTYIPQPGDDDKTLAQKKQARNLFIQGAYTMAGRAAPKPSESTQSLRDGSGDSAPPTYEEWKRARKVP